MNLGALTSCSTARTTACRSLDAAARHGRARRAAAELRRAVPQLPRLGPPPARRPRRARRAAAQHRARPGAAATTKYVMRGYHNLVEGLWRLGPVRRGGAAPRRGRRPTARDRGLPGPRLHVRRPPAPAAGAARATGRRPRRGCARRSSTAASDPGMLGRETLPALARLLVRRGADDADGAARRAGEHAARPTCSRGWCPPGSRQLEHAWLTGAPPRPRGSPPRCC